mgnify:CR=1 FL=1
MVRITMQTTIGKSLRVAIVAGLVSLAPVAAFAATAPAIIQQDSMFAAAATSPATREAQYAALVDMPTPALSPGLPPPQLSALSDRRIVGGLLLVVLAGASAVTAAMWRELGRRVETS